VGKKNNDGIPTMMSPLDKLHYYVAADLEGQKASVDSSMMLPK
jgi:hypothetical protein